MRSLVAAAVLSLLSATGVFAADAADTTTPTSLDVSAVVVASTTQNSPTFATNVVGSRRPSALLPMYAMSFALQGYDAYSTLSALRAGGREANPLMRPVVGSPVAFTAVKVGTAAAALFVSEHMWKTHHRAAAVAMMVASNVGMAVVATNNAHVLSTLK